MPTTRRPAFVSFAAITMAFALAACAHAPSRPVTDGLAPEDSGSSVIRFDNQGRERVHVYLVGAERQWLLGPVEAGAVTKLRIPDAALAEGEGFMRLAVVTNARVTLQAARNARALTIAQPASEILSQRWRFAQGELTSLKR